MLQHVNPEEVLFLDIETVPQCASFNELEAGAQTLWEEKSKFTREKRGLELAESYGEAGIYAEFGKIICISAGYFSTKHGERNFRVSSFFGHDERLLLQEFAEMLNRCHNQPFRLLCAHNGKEFDFPYICRRMIVNGIPLPVMLDLAGKKPWEIPHLDTMELWKFGDYKHYTSLKLLAHIFGIPTPKDDIDGSQVRGVYYDEQNLDRIETYCKKDVVTIARVFMRYRGEEVLTEDEVMST